MIRRNLTPPIGIPLPGLPPTRRAGGARRNVSYRVTFLRDAAEPGGSRAEVPGWALNLSRGGVRAIVEDRVELGEELEVDIEEERLKRRGRIVWTQEEPDGMIVGVAFLERLEAAPPGLELDSSIEISPGDLARKLDMTEDELKAALAAPEGDGGEGGRPA